MDSLLSDIQKDDSIYYKLKKSEREKERRFLEKYGIKRPVLAPDEKDAVLEERS